jgi:hypothetical protein
VDGRSLGIRFRRILGAGFAVIALSLLLLFVPVIVYAFVLAFRARGAPDQVAINVFAAMISRALMPWLVRLLTLLLAFWVVRRNGTARAVDGLFVGVLAGVLSLAVTLAFGGRLDVRNLLLFLVVVVLGWLGGLVGRRMSPRA